MGVCVRSKRVPMDVKVRFCRSSARVKVRVINTNASLPAPASIFGPILPPLYPTGMAPSSSLTATATAVSSSLRPMAPTWRRWRLRTARSGARQGVRGAEGGGGHAGGLQVMPDPDGFLDQP